MELTIVRRAYVLKHADIYRSGTSIGYRVEINQQRLPIELNFNVAEILRILFLIDVWLSNRISEIEPQFIGSGRQWNMVLKPTLPSRIFQVGRECLPHSCEQANIRNRREEVLGSRFGHASIEIMIRLPATARYVHVRRSSTSG